MALASGSRIGPYRITSQIGAGGMGEVFHAVDVNLGRAAAIKVLPPSLAGDPERLARFEREAQTLASLNHPNIAQVFGFEKGEDSFRALAMEFVEGPTLADRVSHGPMPLDEAIAIAIQIADALESAHDHGIIHRDLKPLNIKVRPDGTVKVLDFGLAKAVAPTSESALSPSANVATITTPAMTHAGVVLGTASYMSPEQAKGRAVDRRADIWAFGCVLFEMLTGRRAFDGPDVSEVAASVLRDEPSWAALPPATPPHVRALLHRCLQKDARKRLPHIGVARLELAEPPPAAPAPTAERSRGVWRAVAAAAVAVSLLLAAWVAWPWRAAAPAAPMRLRIDLGAANTVVLGNAMALAPDGQVLAFVGFRPGDSLRTSLYVRQLARLDAEQLAGTETAQLPFFSPDGQWIAFFAEGMLKKIPAGGGAVVSICAAPSPRGGWWGDDDAIVFASPAGISRVSAAGGSPEVLVSSPPGEALPQSPHGLPHGRGVLYARAISSDPSAGTLFVHDFNTGTAKELVQGGRFPAYAESGHLTFVRGGTLYAAPFDLDTLELTGAAVPVVERVSQAQLTALANMALSASGTMAYRPGAGILTRQAPVMWLTQAGPLTPLRGSPAAFAFPRFSPDGTRLAMSITDGRQSDVWVYDWERGTLTRITTDPGSEVGPVWTPDGTGLVFASARGTNVPNIFWQRADGTGDPRQLTTSNVPQIPNAINPDGTLLVFHEGDPSTTRQALGLVPLERAGDGTIRGGPPSTLIGGAFLKSNARISPDGKWIAYAANDTGAFEIYVQPFPGLGDRVQVSNGGGNLALWSPRRNELYYARPGEVQLLAVPFTTRDGRFLPARPRRWSETRFSATPPVAIYGPGFDLHPDGARFAVTPPLPPVDDGGGGTQQIVLLLNFFDELRRLAPVR
jgi:serine/threonine-protein kinase